MLNIRVQSNIIYSQVREIDIVPQPTICQGFVDAYYHPQTAQRVCGQTPGCQVWFAALVSHPRASKDWIFCRVTFAVFQCGPSWQADRLQYWRKYSTAYRGHTLQPAKGL